MSLASQHQQKTKKPVEADLPDLLASEVVDATAALRCRDDLGPRGLKRDGEAGGREWRGDGAKLASSGRFNKQLPV